MKEEGNVSNSGDKVLYFLVGGFIGASVALLFAPRSGGEMRNMIGTKYREGSERLGQSVQRGRGVAAEKGRELGERVSQIGSDISERVSEAGRDLSDKVSESIDRGKGQATRQRDQIASAIEAGKKAYHDEREKLQPDGESDA